MLELNRKAEVAIHCQAADMEFTINRRGKDDWHMTIEAPADLHIAAGDDGSPTPQPLPRLKREYVLSDAQAAATLALFIGDDALDDVTTEALYTIAETQWENVEQHFRPIP